MSEPSSSSEGFYKVPNESEINEQLDMEERVKKLAAELEEKQKELEYQKQRMLEKKIKEIEDKKTELNQRLEEIDDMPDYDDSENKMKAIEIKKRALKLEEEERQKQEELVALRREQELEKIVRKKMELERLLEEKQNLNKHYRDMKTQLEVIREEKERKDLDSVKLLEKALERGHVLKDQIKKGALSEEDKVLLAETYLQDRLDAQNIQERLLNEVQAHRFQESQKANLDTKEKIKNLNEIRFALREKEEKLLKQKALHHEMMKKGVDYLAEIELGNAPPREFIEKNIKYNPDEYRNTKELNEVLQHGPEYIEEAEEKIEDLMEDQERIKAYLAKNAGYKGELKPFLARARPQSLEMAAYVLEFILKKVDGYIDRSEQKIKRARQEAEVWEDKAAKVEKKQGLFAVASASKGISTDMIERVVDAMVLELATEMDKINDNAKGLALSILFRGLRIERNLDKTDSQLIKGFFDLRGGARKRHEKYKFPFKDREEIAAKDIKADKKKGQDSKRDQERDEEVEYNQTDLDPDKDCIENVGSYETRRLELEYFENVVLEDNDVIQFFSKVKGGIAAMTLSANGHFFAISTTTGVLGLINIKSSPPQLSLVLEESNYIPHILKFSHDSCSQLLALDVNGLMKSYLLNGNPASKLSNLSWLPLKENEVRPHDMTEYYTLDWKYLSRQKNRIINEKEMLQITQCGFFSTFTILGFQSSVLVGAKNGTIMRFSSNKRLNGNNMQNSLFKTTNMKTLAKTDPELASGSDPIKPKPGPKNSTPHVFREFFIGHQSEIIFVTILENPPNLLTIDKDGRIFMWEYSDNYLHSDASFVTKERFKIKLDVVVYQSVGEKQQTFPPSKNAQQAVVARQGEEKFKEYDASADFKARVLNIKKSPDLGLTEITIHKNRLPVEGQVEAFQFVTIKDNKVVLEQDQNHRAVVAKGFVGNIQGSANNKFIYLQLVLPHKLKSDSSNIVYVGFNTLKKSLKKLKITLEVPKLDRGVDFIVSDNFMPLGGSYLYMLLRDGIYMISLATGLIVKIFKDHFDKIDKNLKMKFEFDQLQIHRNKDLYLASTGMGTIWKFKIADQNPTDNVQEAEAEKGELLKLLNM